MHLLSPILNTRSQLGEGPLWHPDEKLLYWTDIEKHYLYRWKPGEGPEEFKIGLPVGAFGFRGSGGLVLAVKDGFAFYDPSREQLEYIHRLENLPEDARFNDGKVDPQGRFWAGTMSDRAENHLYRLDPDHSLHVMLDEVRISNGIGWSSDSKLMYYTDTPTLRIDLFDFDPESGEISNRRVFAQNPQGDGFPDGLTVDSEGCVWIALWDGWKVVKFTPDGRIDAEVRLPVQRPTSCTFGGEGLKELFITSAFTGLDAQELEAQPGAGGIFRVEPGASGMRASFYLD